MKAEHIFVETDCLYTLENGASEQDIVKAVLGLDFANINQEIDFKIGSNNLTAQMVKNANHVFNPSIVVQGFKGYGVLPVDEAKKLKHVVTVCKDYKMLPTFPDKGEILSQIFELSYTNVKELVLYDFNNQDIGSKIVSVEKFATCKL